jgi:hypothetical protein
VDRARPAESAISLDVSGCSARTTSVTSAQARSTAWVPVTALGGRFGASTFVTACRILSGRVGHQVAHHVELDFHMMRL